MSIRSDVEEILNRIREVQPRYAEPAYLMVLAALEMCQEKREVRGHINGEELAWACRDFALREYGLMARTVLSHWGVNTTEDLGAIVFDLIEANLLVRDASDSIENFDSVFDFRTAFDLDYPWSGVTDLVRAEEVAS